MKHVHDWYHDRCLTCRVAFRCAAYTVPSKEGRCRIHEANWPYHETFCDGHAGTTR